MTLPLQGVCRPSKGGGWPYSFAETLLGRRIKSQRTFTAGMVNRLDIDLNVPEIVPDEFVLQCCERVRSVSRILLVYASPIDQRDPTRPTVAGLGATRQALGLAKAV